MINSGVNRTIRDILEGQLKNGVNILLKNKEVFTGKVLHVSTQSVTIMKEPDEEGYLAWINIDDVSAVFQDDDSYDIGHGEDEEDDDEIEAEEDGDDYEEDVEEIDGKELKPKTMATIMKKKTNRKCRIIKRN